MTLRAGRIGLPAALPLLRGGDLRRPRGRRDAPARGRGARRPPRHVVGRPPGTRIPHSFRAGEDGPRLPRLRDARAERHRLLPALGQGEPARRRRHGADRAPRLLGRRAVAAAARVRRGGHGPARARRRVDPDASVETLAGVGPKVAERLGRLGLAHRARPRRAHPARLPRLGARRPSFGELSRSGEEATVALHGRARPRAPDPAAQPQDRRGGRRRRARACATTAVWFNQAWLARQLAAGHRAPRARDARARRRLHGRAPRDRRRPGLHTVGLVPEYRGERGGARRYRLRDLRRGGAAARPLLSGPAPRPPAPRSEGLPLRADALAAAHRPREPRRGRDGARAARARGAARPPAAASTERRRELEEEASAPALSARRRADRALPRRAPVHAHARAGARDRRDRRRPRRTTPDAAPPPGRRRLRARPSSRSTRSCAPSSAATRAR